MKTVTTIITSEYKSVLEDIKSGAKQIFITGNAGTGKSTLLNYILTQTCCIKVAPTGVAATNIKGMTIHSFFNISPVEANIYKTRPLSEKKAQILFEADAIVIDEISMVSSLLLDQINIVCQRSLKNKELFGGKQIIMFGDVGQLQPVINSSLKVQLDKLYASSMFFDSNSFKACKDVKYHCLTKNFRQQDLSFSKTLDSIRLGKTNSEHLAVLNSRLIDSTTTDDNAIYLASTNDTVNALNDIMLEEIPGKTYEFKAAVVGKFKTANTVLVENLKLKKGCKIMMLSNCSESGEYVNGTLGTFDSYNEEDHLAIVLINGKKHKIEPVVHEEIQYDLNDKGQIINNVIGSFQQFPIKIGYAITIHKSQGMTFDKTIILNGKGFFGEGQGYVALSRCRTLEGITLEKPVKKSDFKTNHYSINWLNEKLQLQLQQ